MAYPVAWGNMGFKKRLRSRCFLLEIPIICSIYTAYEVDDKPFAILSIDVLCLQLEISCSKVSKYFGSQIVNFQNIKIGVWAK